MDEQTREALAPIVSALEAIGYEGETIWDAATRMAFAPEVASDLVNLAQSPRDEWKAGARWTQRALPGGLTVTALVNGYGFALVGAFLMAAALVSHTDEATVVLDRLLAEGRWDLKPDGSYEHVIVPAAERLPLCPVCADRVPRRPNFCGSCGAALTWDGERLAGAGLAPE